MSLYEYANDLDIPVHPISALDYMPREQLEAIQLHRLKATVQRCYDHVPITRRRMDERGVRPEHIKTLKDIALLPFMMKKDSRSDTGRAAAFRPPPPRPRATRRRGRRAR